MKGSFASSYSMAGNDGSRQGAGMSMTRAAEARSGWASCWILRSVNGPKNRCARVRRGFTLWPVLGRRGGLLGHAWLQPIGWKFGGRDGGRRHDRRRVYRRLLREGKIREYSHRRDRGNAAPGAGQDRRVDRRPRHG